MKNKTFINLFCIMALLGLGCSNDQPVDSELTIKSDQLRTVGATQISGVAYFAAPEQCDTAGQGADFTLYLTGDLEGCLYVFVDDHECSPSGTYREEGRELFVGTYHGEEGTFWTNYKFEAKFDGCEDGFFVGAEIFGRCQHPIMEGSGTGVFDGVKGRLDIKDDVEAHTFEYRGHLKF